jgi:hypothetical protein
VSIDDGEYRFELVSSLPTTSLRIIVIETREEMRDRDREKERNGERCKQTANHKTTVMTMAEKREREKYTKKNHLCMNNTEQNDMNVERLVISLY